jgi:hypothetical protein
VVVAAVAEAARPVQDQATAAAAAVQEVVVAAAAVLPARLRAAPGLPALRLVEAGPQVRHRAALAARPGRARRRRVAVPPNVNLS